jgi:hypothetical protein
LNDCFRKRSAVGDSARISHHGRRGGAELDEQCSGVLGMAVPVDRRLSDRLAETPPVEHDHPVIGG